MEWEPGEGEVRLRGKMRGQNFSLYYYFFPFSSLFIRADDFLIFGASL
jgi:hypothetical protein